REAVEMKRMNARTRSLADDQIDAKILHRGIEHFFDCRLQAMNFIEEENFARIEGGKNRGEITLAVEQRSGAGLNGNAEFMSDDLRQGGFAKTGRTIKQDVIERFAAVVSGFECDCDILFYFFLTDVLVQRSRANAGVQARVVVVGCTRNEPFVSFAAV